MKKEIIYLGDSIIAWDGFLNNGNYGVPGFTTTDLLWKLQGNNDIIGDIVVLMIGVNDVLSDCSIKSINENIEKIIELLKVKFKEIIVISILPTMYKDINKNIIEINNVLSTYKNIKFLDIYSLFLGEEEKIDNKFSSDGVHLSTYAYDILNKKIEEALHGNLPKMQRNIS